MCDIRGNVETRLRKLDAGEADATLLAAAGLDRLDQSGLGVAIETDVMLPAPAQGAIGIEALAANVKMRRLLSAIDHQETSVCVHMERALLEGLQADCRSPVAALAQLVDGRILLRGEILAPDGIERVTGEAIMRTAPDAMALAADLLARASPDLRALFAA